LSLYPNDIEIKLGFDQIRAFLLANCLGESGQKYVRKLSFSTNTNAINEWLAQTREFLDILSSDKAFPVSNYLEIAPLILHSGVPGQYLDQEELFEIKGVAQTISDILSFFQTNQEACPQLYRLSKTLDRDDSLIQALNAKIDDKGEIRDNASEDLTKIRSRMIKRKVQARTAVNKILREANKLGYCPDGASLTVRDGRMVIPLLAEHKRHVKGFVHDESATGQTVFLEPDEALEINNELRELQYAEKREIVKILTLLTDAVREKHDYLKKGTRLMGIVDFVRAKARLARNLQSICPQVSDRMVIQWQDARHPLLEKSLKEQRKKIVPLTIGMNEKDRIVLISGPNAGGKSVCLKTIGLIQYMVQCGLPVPVAEGSEFGVFSSIFIDIGDDQSIENDLSTYSSHLTHMKYLLKHGDAKTLFLIDEFGTGTEPQFGGAIAEVVLQAINQRKCFGAVTTHYGNLKKMADKTDGLVNAAMKFDTKNLEPLYELEIGKPGSSFALEIAGKIGLDEWLLKKAKKIAGISHVQFDRLLNELESEKSALVKQKTELDQKDKRLAEAIKDYQDLKHFLDKEKKNLINDAKNEAARIIQSSNKKVEATIREIQEAKADKKRTQAAREILQKETDRLRIEGTKTYEPVERAPLLAVGDQIRLKSSDAVGEVVRIKGKQVEIILGGLTSRVKMNEAVKISSKEFKESTHKKIKNISGIDMNAKMASFKASLDLRGNRAEEVIGQVETFLDEAILLGQSEIKILHGKGHGILREIVRNTLKENPRVVRVADEHIERGGSGITVVTIDS